MPTSLEYQIDFDLLGQPFVAKGLYANTGMKVSAYYAGPGFDLTKLIAAALGGAVTIDLESGVIPDVVFNQIEVDFFSTGSKTPPNKKEYTEFNCSGSVSWQKPFGIPLGLNLTNLGLYFKSFKGAEAKKAEIKIVAKLLVGGVEVDVGAYFVDGKLTIIRVNEVGSITVSTVFNHFFGSVITWPSGFIDLTFTDASIYYSAVDAATYVTDQQTYDFLPTLSPPVEQGLNLSSQLTFVLGGVTLPKIDVLINIVKGQGISVTGTLDSKIDFSFLQLTDLTFQHGPSLQITSYGNTKSFGLNCGFMFLNEQFGTAGLKVTREIPSGQSKETTVLSATLEYTGSASALAPFKNIPLTLSYSKEAGFQVDNWPGMKEANVAIDWLKNLKKVAASGGCQKIVGDIISNQTVVESNFFINPQLTTKLPDSLKGTVTGPDGTGTAGGGAKFYVVLRGMYKISALSQEVCTIDMPTIALAFTAPTQFSFDGIGQAIINNLTTNAESIVQQLWNDKAALAKFTAIFIGKEALKKAAAKGICDALKDAAEKLIDALGEAGLAALGEGAAAALGALGAAFGAIGAACSSGHHHDNHGGSGGGGGGGSIPIGPLPQTANITKSYASKKVTIGWDAVAHAASYLVMVKGTQDGKSFYQYQSVLAGDPRTATLDLVSTAQPDLESSYLISVQSLPTGSSYYYAGAPKTTSLRQIGMPGSPTLKYDALSKALQGNFQAVAGATSYLVQIVGATSHTVVATPTATPATQPATGFSVNVPTNTLAQSTDTSFYMQVQAIGGDQYLPGEFAKTASLDLLLPIGTVVVGETFLIG